MGVLRRNGSWKNKKVVDEEMGKLQRFMIPDIHVDTVGADTYATMITNGKEQIVIGHIYLGIYYKPICKSLDN